MINPFSFTQLLYPVTSDDFFEQYWEKKPLFLAGRGSCGYQDLLTLRDFDALLFSHVAVGDYPWVRFANNQKLVGIGEYVNSRNGLLDRRLVLKGFREGNSICLDNLRERFEPFKKVCQMFEEVFGHPNEAWAFLTPARSQGFRAHFDQYDVFILQMEGCKRWKVYDICVPSPLVASDTPYVGKLPDPLHEIDLKPGDLLYLPRGCVHEAIALEEHSLHVTVGIKVFTWVDLIYEIAATEPELRKALPIRSLLARDVQDVDVTCLGQITELCKDRDRVELAFRKLKAKFTKVKNCSFAESFETPHSMCEIDCDTLFKKREGLLCSLITENCETVIHFGDEVIRGPSHMEDALQYIIDTPQFSIKTMPNSLTESGKRALVKTLIERGLVVPGARKEITSAS